MCWSLLLSGYRNADNCDALQDDHQIAAVDPDDEEEGDTDLGGNYGEDEPEPQKEEPDEQEEPAAPEPAQEQEAEDDYGEDFEDAAGAMSKSIMPNEEVGWSTCVACLPTITFEGWCSLHSVTHRTTSFTSTHPC